MSNKEVAARIAAKKAGMPVDDEPESGEWDAEPFWEPDENEVALHRERGRRVHAESRARAADTKTVIETAMEFFDEYGLGDNPQKVLDNLQIVFRAGGQQALDEVLARIEAEGYDLDEISQHVDGINAQLAQQQEIANQAAWEQHQQTLKELDDRICNAHQRRMSDRQLNASLELIAQFAGTEASPYSTDDPAERENRWRTVFALGRDKADHAWAQEKKAEIMGSVPRLVGEDESQPRDVARGETFYRLGYINEQGEWDPDQTWNPARMIEPVFKTREEVEIEHDGRRWLMREHLDHPQGFGADHPFGEPLRTEREFGDPVEPVERESEWGTDWTVERDG